MSSLWGQYQWLVQDIRKSPWCAKVSSLLWKNSGPRVNRLWIYDTVYSLSTISLSASESSSIKWTGLHQSYFHANAFWASTPPLIMIISLLWVTVDWGMHLAKTITFIDYKTLFTISKGNFETIINDSTFLLGLLLNTWADLYRLTARRKQTCWL